MRSIFTITLLSAVAAAQGGPAPATRLQPGDALPRLDHVPQVGRGFCAQCLVR